MKVLLNQHGLDKPFSGGIGSFKLYVLVASHVSLARADLLLAISICDVTPPLTKNHRSTYLDNRRLSNT